MDGLRRQPDFHDLLRMEDDSLSPTKGTASPEHILQNSLNNNSSKINTPAKVLMVGEPVQVKTELSEDHPNEKRDASNDEETSGSSAEELAGGIATPSPETAAAMESLIAADDLTAASPKLDVPKSPTPVNFTTANSNRVIVRPQTSIISSLKPQQPISIAGKKFVVAAQPVQVVRKEGGGGPIVTKFVVKRTSASAVSSQKSPVVFTKGKVVVTTAGKRDNFKSGSILLSPIKGGFKIPISPIKSPMKVSVIPPGNSHKLSNISKPITVPIQTSIPQLQRRQQTENNTICALNGIIQQSNKGFISQQPILMQNRQPISNLQVDDRHSQQVQRLNVTPNGSTRQDSQGMKIQYVQLLPHNNGTQEPTLRSNQGQPITFTSMSQIGGSNLSLKHSNQAIAFLSSNLTNLQQSSSSQRKAQTVKVAIPSQSTHQAKPQRLIMPATSISNQAISALNTGNISYAMVPAKYVEQLTKQLNSKTSFSPDTSIHPGSKPVSVKVCSNGKLKKPCNCTKSQCLKLYCECFANGQFCDECNCLNCFNNLDHEAERSKAVKQCLERNPSAFRPKIGRGKDDNRTHQKGCNCKRSGCLKNYCECYEARIPCTSRCKCIGCKNYEESGDRRSLMSLADAAEVRVQQQTAAKAKLSNQIGEIKTATKTTLAGERLPYTFFTQEVIEATCTCLLAQAEEAEKTSRPLAVAEAMILEEFGRCVMQIIQSAGKAKVSNIN